MTDVWPTKVPVLDEDEVHELLHQVDEEEARQHQDLGHGEPGVREGPGGYSGHHDLVDVRQHVGEAGGKAGTWRDISQMLRQLSYAIKTSSRHPKPPYLGHFLPSMHGKNLL